VARAREIPVLEYVLRYESGSFKPVGNGYRSKEHQSLAVSDKGFFWHSNDIGGKTAIDYLMAVKGFGFVNAVCHLIGEAPYEKGDKPMVRQGRSPPKQPPQAQTSIQNAPAVKDMNPQNKPQPKQQSIILPRRNKDNYRVIAYLQNRGISRDIIMGCINRGVLYESAPHHNAVFLGKDERGKTRFAAMRGIVGGFKCDAEGSDKRYGFVTPPQDPASQALMLFESPIDSLSHQTLCNRGSLPGFGGWRLSLGGSASIAALHFLEQHPEIGHCIIATDSDKAGEKTADKITAEIGITAERLPPPYGNDWNDALVGVLHAERTRGSLKQNSPVL